MKLKLLLVIAAIPVLFISCYKKLYLSTENDNTIIQGENHVLSNENNIITSQQSEVQKKIFL